MARIRLLCSPFAGAGVVGFRPWARFLPPHVEAFAVLLPGREDAIAEAPLTDWGAMRHALIDAVSSLPTLPTAIFGHSLGAVIGLDLARRSEEHTSELQSLMRISYAVFCLKQKQIYKST